MPKNMGRWFSVEEELPQEPGRYLVNLDLENSSADKSNDPNPFVMHWDRRVGWTGLELPDTFKNSLLFRYVTHWRFLPTLPHSTAQTDWDENKAKPA